MSQYEAGAAAMKEIAAHAAECCHFRSSRSAVAGVIRCLVLPGDPAGGGETDETRKDMDEAERLYAEEYHKRKARDAEIAVLQNDLTQRAKLVAGYAAQNAELRTALQSIADANPTDLTLDPQWPSRIAAAALRGEKL